MQTRNSSWSSIITASSLETALFAGCLWLIDFDPLMGLGLLTINLVVTTCTPSRKKFDVQENKEKLADNEQKTMTPIAPPPRLKIDIEEPPSRRSLIEIIKDNDVASFLKQQKSYTPKSFYFYQLDKIPLLEAAASLNHQAILDAIYQLHQQFADNKQELHEGKSLLHMAAQCRQPSYVLDRLIDDAGADGKDSKGRTPLYIASSAGYTQGAQVLLHRKASPDGQRKNDLTPLQASARGGHTQVAQLLLDSKADIDAKRSDNVTALHIAVSTNKIDMVTTLIDRKADLNVKTKGYYKDTPIQTAFRHNYHDIAFLLWNKGASVSDQTNKRMQLEKELRKFIASLSKTSAPLSEEIKAAQALLTHVQTRGNHPLPESALPNDATFINLYNRAAALGFSSQPAPALTLRLAPGNQ
jgi:hypothetical protein